METVQDALDDYFPDARVELRSIAELKQWLRAHVPVAIAAWMLRSRSLKVCSGISPAFAEVLFRDGWPAVTCAIPRHQFNVVVTLEGFVKVDMSAIQFQVCDQDDYDEVRGLLRQVARNPFRAIEVKRYASWPAHVQRVPDGRSGFSSMWDPLKDYDNTERWIRKHGLEEFPDFLAEIDAANVEAL